MSVPREQITAYSVVETLLVLIHVTATLVTDLLQMVGAVMVILCPLKRNCHLIRFVKHTDINECTEGTENCQQLCNNTDGSFTCDCSTGYRLASDSHSCNGQSIKFTYTGDY